MTQAVTLQTERLVLRSLTPADIPAMVVLLDDYQVSRWLSVVPHPYTAADGDAFLDFLHGADPLTALAIQAREGLVGVVGIDDSLGYWLGRAHHGNGYMREAASALVAHYFATRHAAGLASGYFTGNAASARILNDLGFRPSGQKQARSRAQDIDLTLEKMYLSRADWQAKHAELT